MAVCAEIPPPPIAVAADHHVACHLYGEAALPLPGGERRV
jgi:hypothetical protein